MDVAQMDQTHTPERAIRDFSRFYTRRMGLLEPGFLDSRFTLAQARVLYELATREDLSASTIAQELGLDAGYLSRILSRFRQDGLLQTVPSKSDGRRSLLRLTEAGREAFAPLDRASHAQAGELVGALGVSNQRQLVRALSETRMLVDPSDRRPIGLGDLGWIAHRQGLLYHDEYGFDVGFEALVAEILVAFARRAPARGERGWIADRDDAVAGSVFLMRESDEVGRLRLLYVEPALRGQGVGRRLVDACIDGARAAGYRRMVLWTNDIAPSAATSSARTGN
jgi:DNA-binding MarR family transcriptional regulator/predicted GNAT family acetyltransferase